MCLRNRRRGRRSDGEEEEDAAGSEGELDSVAVTWEDLSKMPSSADVFLLPTEPAGNQ